MLEPDSEPQTSKCAVSFGENKIVNPAEEVRNADEPGVYTPNVSENDLESGSRVLYSRGGTGVSIKNMDVYDDDGLIAEQMVEIRPPEMSLPASRTRRFRRWLFWRKKKPLKAGLGGKLCLDTNEYFKSSPPQYTITSRKKTVGQPSWYSNLVASFGMGKEDEFSTHDVGFLGLSILNFNEPTLWYLNWCFRASFLTVFFSMLVFFMMYVLVFAVFVHIAAHHQPECTSLGFRLGFLDSFSLSWTTFSTVGYGLISPSISVTDGVVTPSDCGWIQFLLTVESFVGVLFSGYCGAVLFGKITRMQSQAQVIFSDPLVIRYGHGVDSGADESGESSDDEKSLDIEQKIPCPVLEFRIVNMKANSYGGELVDAMLTCVAATEGLVDEFTLNGMGNGQYADTNEIIEDGSDIGRSKSKASRKYFNTLEVDSCTHPFFKRVWLVRHTLDENSPLLKPSVKRRIKKCGGYWPSVLNHANGVRSSIMFDQIIVSLSGTFNITATTVYSHKIYEYVDLNVGYQFVPVLYRSKGKLLLDKTLVNDVTEQTGGGGEDLCVGQ